MPDRIQDTDNRTAIRLIYCTNDAKKNDHYLHLEHTTVRIYFTAS